MVTIYFICSDYCAENGDDVLWHPSYNKYSNVRNCIICFVETKKVDVWCGSREEYVLNLLKSEIYN